MILLFHNVGIIKHHCWVKKKRLIEICKRLKPDEIHFDDANINAFDTILHLKNLGFTVKVFVPVAFIDAWLYSDGYFPVRVMSGQRLTILVKRGVIIGSHSVTHRDMCGLTMPVIHSEFLESKEFLDACLCKVTEFAFPVVVPRNNKIIELGNMIYDVCYGLDEGIPGLAQRYPVSSTCVKIEGREVLIEDLSA